MELGGFNYSDAEAEAEAHRNSENVQVNWCNPKLAEVTLKRFDRNYAQVNAYENPY